MSLSNPFNLPDKPCNLSSNLASSWLKYSLYSSINLNLSISGVSQNGQIVLSFFTNSKPCFIKSVFGNNFCLKSSPILLNVTSVSKAAIISENNFVSNV